MASQSPTTGRLPRRAALLGLTAIPIVGAGGLAIAAVPEARSLPDAELMRLLRQMLEAFEAGQAAQRRFIATASDDDGCHADDTWAATGRIVDEIERQRATTVAGLAVKALACSWCYAEPGNHYDPKHLSEYCQDVRLALGIVDDLLLMRKGGA